MSSEVAVLFGNPKILGASLKVVAQDVLVSQGQRITSQWYHSDHEVDLFVWKNDMGHIVKQQLSFMGEVVEWNMLEGVRTGMVMGESDPYSKRMAYKVRYDQKLGESSLQRGIEILTEACEVESHDRKSMILNFTGSKRESKLRLVPVAQSLKNARRGIWHWIQSLVGIFRKSK